ncbi:hypothetical protein GQ53DRAFT_803106 [Thozetella sp. PMI_491]|nr:hypothetical protein GQ53DRAFT_803106 [Thozetella sp. PMI_491]
MDHSTPPEEATGRPSLISSRHSDMDPSTPQEEAVSRLSSTSSRYSEIQPSTLPEATNRWVPESGLEVDDPMERDTHKECVYIDNPPIPCHPEDPFGDQGVRWDGQESNPGSPGFSGQSDLVESSKGRSRRKLFMWIGAGLLLLAIGGGVGGYFGWRAAHQSSENALTTSGGAPSGPPTGSVIVLAYKAPDGSMKASLSISSWGSLAGKNSSWQDTPQSVTSPSLPENGTGFAMTGFASSSLREDGNTSKPIYSVTFMALYVNKTGFINGVKYIDTSAAAGTTQEEINQRSYSVKSGSNVAAYWPWVVFQDWSGFINVANSMADPPYSNKALKSVAIEGTKLAVVPLSTKYTKITNSSYGVFYQMANGQLAATVPGPTVWGDEDPTASWPSTSTFPNITLPARASFAAFSYARNNDTDEDTVTTFVLYQDETASIKQVWTDDSQTWQSSSPAALAVADYGTNIACMTPSASNDTYGIPLDITPQSNLTRCYFQRGGWPVEVQLNGTDWVDLGRLPMP